MMDCGDVSATRGISKRFAYQWTIVTNDDNVLFCTSIHCNQYTFQKAFCGMCD